MRDRQKSNDLLKAFRESRQQVQRPVDNSVDNVDKSRRKSQRTSFTRGYEARPKSSDPYTSFLDKYHHLSETVDEFKTQDLMYFFREKARECGIKYVITAVTRDMAIFKRLAKNYEIREVLLMIEFLFSDEQDYLDKVSLQPTILASRWLNTIYADSIAWSNDEYVPHNKRRKSNTSNREWTSTDDEHSTKIGEW